MKRIGCFFLCIFLLNIQITYAEENVEVVSEFAYVYNLDDEQSIYEKNADAKLYPASMTKIMTALVVLEQCPDLQEKITITPKVLEGLAQQNASVAGFVAGENLSILDLLYGVMLPSGADATRALAYHISGSEEAFVELMNAKAEQLQLVNTHFANTSGLHDEKHFSNAKEIAKILQEALKNETFQTIFATNQYRTGATWIHPNGLLLTSTRFKQQLSANIELDLSGGKTGYTIEGGLCLASTLDVNGASYIVITANAGQDVERAQNLIDTKVLYDYLETKYTKEIIFKAKDSVGSAKVLYGSQDYVDLIAQVDVSVFKQKQESSNYEIQADDIYAPVEEGEQLATLIVQKEGETYEEIPLYAKQSIELNKVWIFTIGGICLFLLFPIILGIRKVMFHNRQKKQ